MTQSQYTHHCGIFNWTAWPLNLGLMHFPITSEWTTNYHATSQKRVDLSSFIVLCFISFSIFIPLGKILRLRWSRGSVLAFSTQVCGFKPGRSRRIFRIKILSTPSFRGEVKLSVPCRRFAACKRSLNLRGSRNLGKITGHFLTHSSTFRC